jgi:hypothetical protein
MDALVDTLFDTLFDERFTGTRAKSARHKNTVTRHTNKHERSFSVLSSRT